MIKYKLYNATAAHINLQIFLLKITTDRSESKLYSQLQLGLFLEQSKQYFLDGSGLIRILGTTIRQKHFSSRFFHLPAINGNIFIITSYTITFFSNYLHDRLLCLKRKNETFVNSQIFPSILSFLIILTSPLVGFSYLQVRFLNSICS